MDVLAETHDRTRGGSAVLQKTAFKVVGKESRLRVCAANLPLLEAEEDVGEGREEEGREEEGRDEEGREEEGREEEGREEEGRDEEGRGGSG